MMAGREEVKTNREHSEKEVNLQKSHRSLHRAKTALREVNHVSCSENQRHIGWHATLTSPQY